MKAKLIASKRDWSASSQWKKKPVRKKYRTEEIIGSMVRKKIILIWYLWVKGLTSKCLIPCWVPFEKLTHVYWLTKGRKRGSLDGVGEYRWGRSWQFSVWDNTDGLQERECLLLIPDLWLSILGMHLQLYSPVHAQSGWVYGTPHFTNPYWLYRKPDRGGEVCGGDKPKTLYPIGNLEIYWNLFMEMYYLKFYIENL